MKNKTAAKVRTAIVAAMSGIAMMFAMAFIGISCVCGGAVCVIAKHNEADNRREFERMKNRFGEELAEFNGLFTAEKARSNSSSGINYYYFSYHGNSENFISDCVDFCNGMPKGENMPPYEELHIAYGTRLYFNLNTSNRLFSTNVYMEDYSAIEKFEENYKLVMSLSKFTEEQQEHLKSIQNDYSFEIILQ